MKVFVLVVLAAVYVQADPTPFALQVRDYTALVSTSLRSFRVMAAGEYNDKIKQELRPVIRLKLKNSADRMDAKMQVLFDKWKVTYQENRENDGVLARKLVGFSAKMARAHGEAQNYYQNQIKPLLTDHERRVMRSYWTTMSAQAATMQTSFATFFDANLKPTILQLQAEATAAQTLTDDAAPSLSPFADSVKQYSLLMGQKLREVNFQLRAEYDDKIKDQLSREVRMKVKTLNEKMTERTMTVFKRWTDFFRLHKDSDEDLVRGLSNVDTKLVDAWRKARRFLMENIVPLTNAQERELLRSFQAQAGTLFTTMKAEMDSAFSTMVAPFMPARPAA
ncbi:Hypp3758 [Branchiostoma lanceolatum]|uniref:Hypp3758 protein n=1 Tax=Branchiostoma lanceolatum TaxID=7740 RepID=A0A8K0A4S7_BRALA|nr:Hypp3758 [Branchiostoma lanceolatum]